LLTNVIAIPDNLFRYRYTNFWNDDNSKYRPRLQRGRGRKAFATPTQRALARCVKTRANRHSTFDVHYSIFKGLKLKNIEHRLTNDEFRISDIINLTSNRPRLQRGRARKAFATPTQRALARYTTMSFFQRVLKSFQISPDCSGYNVELAEHYLSGKRDSSSIETLQFRFKKNPSKNSSGFQPVVIKTNRSKITEEVSKIWK